MASVNKVIIVGNLGRDPEMRTFPDGGAITNVSIATTDKWKDKESGEMKEATEWHRVSFSGRMAEIANEYLRQGSQCYVEGSLRTRKWTDKDGVEKYSTEIRAERLQLLGQPRGNDGGDRSQGGQQSRGGDQRQQGGRSNDQRDQGARDNRGNGNSAPPQRSAGQRSNQGRTSAPAPARNQGASGFDDMSDDIPF